MKSDPHYEFFKSSLAEFGNLTESEWEDFYSIWTPLEVGRKVLLSVPGKVENYAYFVLKGIQRLYSVNETGKEATIVFTYDGDFGGVVDSLLSQKPSTFYYETLSKSALLRCRYSDFKRTIDASENLRNMMDQTIYAALSGTLARLVELQCMTSEEKFKSLLNRSPHILTMIPHKYLASYIGIDSTNFSKLINSIKI